MTPIVTRAAVLAVLAQALGPAAAAAQPALSARDVRPPHPVAAPRQAPARLAPAGAPYYPGPGDAWERRAPEQVGMHARQLAAAIAFARANETKAPRDLEAAH